MQGSINATQKDSAQGVSVGLHRNPLRLLHKKTMGGILICKGARVAAAPEKLREGFSITRSVNKKIIL